MYKHNKKVKENRSAFILLLVVAGAAGFYIGMMAFVWGFEHGAFGVMTPSTHDTNPTTLHVTKDSGAMGLINNVQPAIEPYYIEPTYNPQTGR